MDQPSAQSVGREFVRQYYTMLHEAPQFLHRFYSNNSSFVHGGLEKYKEEQPPALGQAEIHKKILSLNFIDCHVKIRQVDSQASIENSVVIQVVGELSNNSGPMRRFMQTFVLAAQSPKKYYLHNDIFRYQDEVFVELADNDADDEICSVEQAQDAQPMQNAQPIQLHDVLHAQSQQVDVSSMQTNASSHQVMSQVEQPMNVDHHLPALSNGLEAHHEKTTVAPAMDNVATVAAPPAAAALAAAVSNDSAAVDAVPSASGVTETGGSRTLHAEENLSVEVNAATDLTAQTSEIAGDVSECDDQRESIAASPEPKVMTWAALAGRKVNPAQGAAVGAKPHAAVRPERKADPSPSAPLNGASSVKPPRVQQQPRAADSVQQQSTSHPAASANVDSNSTRSDAASSGVSTARPGERMGVKDGAGKDGGCEASDNEDGRFRNVLPSYPDCQQVFVGNIPHTVTDLEIKAYFEQFGHVLDIRVNHKPTGSLPNFGFITYETVECVQQILKAMPLPKLFGRHRLNVEEKKPKDQLPNPRPSSGNRPPAPPQTPREAYGPPKRGGGRVGYNGGRGAMQQNGFGSNNARSSSTDSRSDSTSTLNYQQ